MKRDLRLPWAICMICLFLAGGLLPRAEAAKPESVFRFGTVAVYSSLTNRFILHNTTTNLLEIRSITPSCSCISVSQWTAYIEPGVTSAVEILFTPDRVGKVDYRVYVKTSDPKRPDIEYAIQGVVTSAPHARVDRDWSLYLNMEEAAEAVQKPEGILWVDIRNKEAVERARIPDSIQIPLYAIKTKSFLRGRRVVVIDEGYGSRVVDSECRRLREMGFSDLWVWYGGLNAWRVLGGELEGGGETGIRQLPPIALADIQHATDWMVVAAYGGIWLNENVRMSFPN